MESAICSMASQETMRSSTLDPCRRQGAFGGVGINGRYWIRTSDPFRVKEVRYHCANRPDGYTPGGVPR